MFGKWLDEYRKNYLKTRFVSQLPAFLISLLALLSLYNNLYAGYLNQIYVESNGQYFWISNFFHVLIAAFFGFRFVLLFFNSKKSFWFSQLFWIIGLTTLFVWSIYTKGGFYELFDKLFNVPKGVAPCFDCNNSYFSNASDSLETLVSTYFFLSPIRQFFTIVISTFRRW